MVFFVCVIYGFMVSFLGNQTKTGVCKSVGRKDKLLVMSEFSHKKNMQSSNLLFIPLILIIWSFWLLPFNSKSVLSLTVWAIPPL